MADAPQMPEDPAGAVVVMDEHLAPAMADNAPAPIPVQEPNELEVIFINQYIVYWVMCMPLLFNRFVYFSPVSFVQSISELVQFIWIYL